MSLPDVVPAPVPRRRSARGLVPAVTTTSVILLALGLTGACSAPPPPPGQPASAARQPTADVRATPELPTAVLPDGATITLELAVTPEEISNGLMFRPSLRPDRGMLFVFEQRRTPSFWMKNTLIPLDIVFLSGDGTVVDITHDAQPCASDPCPQYVPQEPAWAVLEIAAGLAARHGLEEGTLLEVHHVPGFPHPQPQ